jgi:hypothetical protein
MRMILSYIWSVMQLMAWPILALLEAQFIAEFMGYFLDFMLQQKYALIVGIY